jgi:hypothetical protein
VFRAGWLRLDDNTTVDRKGEASSSLMATVHRVSSFRGLSMAQPNYPMLGFFVALDSVGPTESFNPRKTHAPHSAPIQIHTPWFWRVAPCNPIARKEDPWHSPCGSTRCAWLVATEGFGQALEHKSHYYTAWNTTMTSVDFWDLNH